MTGPLDLDVDHLRKWIGRTETVVDTVSPRLAGQLAATLDQEAAAVGEPAPLAIHWCLAPQVAPNTGLGSDGHPTRGGFLPPVSLPRRMWAGSSLQLLNRLYVGDAVERRSRIADVTLKHGRTGPLCFVTVDHEVYSNRGLSILERQDIVYRAMEPPTAMPPEPVVTPLSGAPVAAIAYRDMLSGPVVLFRYSAITFNGHRIHYDRGYAVMEEAYPGLVVHGPLLATQLLEFAAATNGSAPVRFSFRGLQPLFDFMPYRLCAKTVADGLDLWVETGTGVHTMQANARW